MMNIHIHNAINQCIDVLDLAERMKTINYEANEKKNLIIVREDIKNGVKFIYDLLNRYTTTFNIIIQERDLGLLTANIILNLTKPYLRNLTYMNDIKSKNKTMLQCDICNGLYVPNQEFKDVINYLTQLIEEVSA